MYWYIEIHIHQSTWILTLLYFEYLAVINAPIVKFWLPNKWKTHWWHWSKILPSDSIPCRKHMTSYRRWYDVGSTFLTSRLRHIDVDTTSCVSWVINSWKKLISAITSTLPHTHINNLLHSAYTVFSLIEAPALIEAPPYYLERQTFHRKGILHIIYAFLR